MVPVKTKLKSRAKDSGQDKDEVKGERFQVIEGDAERVKGSGETKIISRVSVLQRRREV